MSIKIKDKAAFEELCLSILGGIFFGVGSALLLSVSWKIFLGVFLFVWANNIATTKK
jgi:hypothetical protein